MAQLRARYDIIQAFDGEVVVISFGTGYWVKSWLEETQSPFPMLLDRERQAYQAYGLERSLLRSWGLKTIWRYVQLLLAGRIWRGIKGDSGQLGGDFIVDSEGILRLAYPSRDPTDRPSIAHLLTVMESLSE